MDYEFVVSCKCKLGLNQGEIGQVSNEIAEKHAENNFKFFKRYFPELVMGI